MMTKFTTLHLYSYQKPRPSASYVFADFDIFKELEKVDFDLEKCTTRTTIRAVKKKKEKKKKVNQKM